jgi:hypothetical protein
VSPWIGAPGRGVDAGTRLSGCEEIRVLLEDALVQRSQSRGWLQAEFLVEDGSGTGVDLEGLRLPSAAVQGRHQDLGKGLLRTVVGHDRVEVRDHLRIQAQRERYLRTFSQGCQMQAPEPR